MPIPPPKTQTRASIASAGSHRGLVIASSHEIKLNRLLGALPDVVLKHWLPQLESINLPLGHVLYESGKTEHSVYFSTSAIVSPLYVMKNGDPAEIAVVGNEGIVGISLFMGEIPHPAVPSYKARARAFG